MGLSVSLIVVSILSYLVYLVAYAIYNVYLHPLSTYPGPKLWIAFPSLRYISGTRGYFDIEMRKLHTKHEVVRFSPNELSFISADAWRDIYGYRQKQLPKMMIGDPTQAPDIISAKDSDHARFRKAMSNGFSEKAMRDQEPIMKVYIDLLISKLRGIALSASPRADMVKWYNLTTFDLIGDLTFGESFNGLETSDMHHWVQNIFTGIKIIPFVRCMREYPLLAILIKYGMPQKVIKSWQQHKEYSKNVVLRRINNRALHGRPDFMDSMVKHKGDKDGLSDEELFSNSNVLILAGSETTATLLSGVTYWLLRNPAALHKATLEVRSTFQTEDEINFTCVTNKLQYMLACLEEALRIYPPVPTGLQRSCQDITVVSGHSLPKGTIVSVHQSGAYRSPMNFHRPEEFIPERWLPESTTNPNSPFFNDNRTVVQPFSVGPRNCIGRNLAYNEMRLILAKVLWSIDLELCEESRDWNEQKAFTLWEKPQLWCRLKVRQE